MTDEPVWDRRARTVIDVVPGRDTSAFDVLATMRAELERTGGNVLSLGPPIRLQVTEESLLVLMDSLPYERIFIRHWPFQLPPQRTG